MTPSSLKFVTGSADRVGRSPSAGGNELRGREALDLASGVGQGVKVNRRIWVRAFTLGLVGRPFGDDEDPDGLDGAVSRLGVTVGSAREGSSGGLDRVDRIGFAGDDGGPGGWAGRPR